MDIIIGRKTGPNVNGHSKERDMGVVGSTGHEPLLGGGKAMVDLKLTLNYTPKDAPYDLKDALRLLLRQ